MLNKKPSLSLSNHSQIKQQVDSVIYSDYYQLNQQPDNPNAIFSCQIPSSNPLIQQYIQVVQHQYNIPSPLKHPRPSSTFRKSSSKKLDLSLKYTSQEPETTRLQEGKSKKRLTLFSNNKMQIQPKQEDFKYQNPQTPIPNTPKFGHHDQRIIFSYQSQDKNHKTTRLTLLQRSNQQCSSNQLEEKYPPIKQEQSQYLQINTTSKKSQSESSININESFLEHSQKEVPERRTVKKELQQQSKQEIQLNSRYTISNHRNPMGSKIQSRIKVQYLSKGVKDSYRYCIGCQNPILQINIKKHEKECEAFIFLSGLSNEELLLKLKQKIDKITKTIPIKSNDIHSDSVQKLRSHSVSLVQQQRKRRSGEGQSSAFQVSYQKIISMGTKWSSALEQVNKLRWFVRISQKLQTLIQNSP